MTVEKIEDIPVHGGSIRVFVRNTPSIGAIIPYSGDDFISNLHFFEEQLFDWKNQFLNTYYSLRKNGMRIWGYGASGRTNIILSFLGIELDEIVDDMESKIGAYMPKSHRQIKHSSLIYTNPPDYIVVLAWPYADNILKKHSQFNGKFIVPLPTINII
jgi:hypothetical protein